MYLNKKIIAVIPARGGSKGIPDKNIIKIDGRPLIDYTISESLKSEYIDRIMVSTDSEKIAEVARECGGEVPFLRPKYLAQNDTKIIDVVIDLLDKLAKNNEEYDYLILLQPTQPLRKSFHIDECIKIAIDNDYSSLVSVNEVNEHPILMRSIDKDDKLHNLLNVNSTVRRQDFPKFYKVNGAIYINKLDKFFNRETSFNDNKFAYVMENKYDLDIDEPFDLEILKLKLSNPL